MRLARGKKKKMITTQAEFKKSLDTGSWGTSCHRVGLVTGLVYVAEFPPRGWAFLLWESAYADGGDPQRAIANFSSSSFAFAGVIFYVGLRSDLLPCFVAVEDNVREVADLTAP
jgi:hypothetical protein